MQQINHPTGFLQNVSKHNFLSTLLGLIAPGSDPTDTLRAVCSLHSHTVQQHVKVTGPHPFSGEGRLPHLPHFQYLRGLSSLARTPAAPQIPPAQVLVGKPPCPQALWGGDPTCCPTLPSADGHLNIPSSWITFSEHYQLWGKHPHR